MVESLIALGSNVGDREANLRRAIAEIRKYARVTKVSSVYETEPMYLDDQEWFLNCVVSVETDLTAAALLDILQKIETEMGRRRSERYGPRQIDLDILFYGREVISEPGLEVPHPKMAERLFVLAPLNEVSPEFRHPVLDKTVAEMSAALKTDKKVIRKPGVLSDPAS